MKRNLSPETRKRMGHGKNKGRDMGGIKDLETMRNRCRIDEDGCWIYAGQVTRERSKKSASVYIRQLEKTLSIGSAVHYIKTGRPTPKGWGNIAQCGKALCMNPECRKLMRPGRHMAIKVQLGDLWLDHAKHLSPAPRKLTNEQVLEVYNTRHEFTAQEQAEKYGINIRYCYLIRSGKGRVEKLIRSAIGPAGMFSQLLRLAA